MRRLIDYGLPSILIVECVILAWLICAFVFGAPPARSSTIQTIPATGFSITGSITHAGRTTTPTSTSIAPPITAGGEQTVSVPVTDPISGAAQLGDGCEVALTAALPAGMSAPYCVITAAGTATVYFPASLVISGGAITYYVMWRG